jgi:hypothetical protein
MAILRAILTLHACSEGWVQPSLCCLCCCLKLLLQLQLLQLQLLQSNLLLHAGGQVKATAW